MLNITAGTNAIAVVVRVRKGTVTGTIVGVATTQVMIATDHYNVPIQVVDSPARRGRCGLRRHGARDQRECRWHRELRHPRWPDLLGGVVKTRGIVLPAASGQLINTAGCLVMHATQESSGSAAAHYKLLDGTDANGSLLVPVSLSVPTSQLAICSRRTSSSFRRGLWYKLVDGAVEGAGQRAHDARL